MYVVVETKSIKLELQIEVGVPTDMIEDKERLKAVEEGILKVISRGLFDDGLVFNIIEIKFDPC